MYAYVAVGLAQPLKPSLYNRMQAISYQGNPGRRFVWTDALGRWPGPSSAPPQVGEGRHVSVPPSSVPHSTFMPSSLIPPSFAPHL